MSLRRRLAGRAANLGEVGDYERNFAREIVDDLMERGIRPTGMYRRTNNAAPISAVTPTRIVR